jgi:hypothetical protein
MHRLYVGIYFLFSVLSAVCSDKPNIIHTLPTELIAQLCFSPYERPSLTALSDPTNPIHVLKQTCRQFQQAYSEIAQAIIESNTELTIEEPSQLPTAFFCYRLGISKNSQFRM